MTHLELQIERLITNDDRGVLLANGAVIDHSSGRFRQTGFTLLGDISSSDRPLPLLKSVNEIDCCMEAVDLSASESPRRWVDDRARDWGAFLNGAEFQQYDPLSRDECYSFGESDSLSKIEVRTFHLRSVRGSCCAFRQQFSSISQLIESPLIDDVAEHLRVTPKMASEFILRAVMSISMGHFTKASPEQPVGMTRSISDHVRERHSKVERLREMEGVWSATPDSRTKDFADAFVRASGAAYADKAQPERFRMLTPKQSGVTVDDVDRELEGIASDSQLLNENKWGLF